MNMKMDHHGDFKYQDKDTGDVIVLRVFYAKAASESRRGIYVTLDPWKIEDGVQSTILFSGTKSIFVERLKQNTPRAVALAAAKIDAHAPVFCQIFRTRGRDEAQAALVAFVERQEVPQLVVRQADRVEVPAGWESV